MADELKEQQEVVIQEKDPNEDIIPIESSDERVKEQKQETKEETPQESEGAKSKFKPTKKLLMLIGASILIFILRLTPFSNPIFYDVSTEL